MLTTFDNRYYWTSLVRHLFPYSVLLVRLSLEALEAHIQYEDGTREREAEERRLKLVSDMLMTGNDVTIRRQQYDRRLPLASRI